MLDTLSTLYVIVAILSFIYALRDESRRTQRGLRQCDKTEVLNRLVTTSFLALVGYPLAFFVACGFVGFVGGLFFLGGRGVLTILGLM